jgi:hypothetical protein
MSGFLFTVGLGAVLSFLWPWTGENRVAAAFSAVNQSLWEQMKLLFFPALLFSLVEVWFRYSRNFLAVRGLTLWVGTGLIPILHYTITGAVGLHGFSTDLTVFLLAAASAFLLDRGLQKTGRLTAGWQQAVGLAALWVLALVFIRWTYRPPHLPLFFDALAGVYGIPN